MGKMGYLAMKVDQLNDELLESDLRELGVAVRKLAGDALLLGSGLGFGTTFLKFLASIAAIYLLILDRTNWRTNMLTSLLIPYIFLSLPSVVFSVLRGEFGKWIAFIGVVLRLFFPRHFPGYYYDEYHGSHRRYYYEDDIKCKFRLDGPSFDNRLDSKTFTEWLEMWGSLILLLVVSPAFFAHTVRDGAGGVLICLAIGCYLLQEHIRASGGFRNSFTKTHGVSNTVGIILLLVYPIWRFVLHFI